MSDDGTRGRRPADRDADRERLPVAPRPDPAHRGDRGERIVAGPRLPAAAAPAAARRGVGNLVLLTLLSAVDGSLLALAAAGRFGSAASATAIGLTVVSGAGSWLAAHQAFAGRRLQRSDLAVLAGIAALAIASTVAAAYLGVRLGTAVSLHVLPKAGGLAICLVAAEVGGLRVPRIARVPLPIALLAVAAVLEVLA